jgi:predicted nuclease with TOPRIM domain
MDNGPTMFQGRRLEGIEASIYRTRFQERFEDAEERLEQAEQENARMRQELAEKEAYNDNLRAEIAKIRKQFALQESQTGKE